MTEMTDFFVAMLNAVADFLGSEPIIYLFALICLAVTAKAVKNIIM